MENRRMIRMPERKHSVENFFQNNCFYIKNSITFAPKFTHRILMHCHPNILLGDKFKFNSLNLRYSYNLLAKERESRRERSGQQCYMNFFYHQTARVECDGYYYWKLFSN